MQSGFPSKKQLGLELAIQNTPLYQEARPALVEYVERLQKATTATDLRLLQRELIFDVNGRQRAIAEAIAENRPSAQERIADLLRQTPKPKLALREAQDQLARIDLVEEVARALQHVTRTLADGLVWRAMNYDRPAISILGKDRPVAYHADEKGFVAELAAMDLVEGRDGTLTFHNDTTNVLRRGDITSVIEVDGQRLPLPREVKAGSGDATKQVERIREALEVLSSRRLLVDVPFRTELAVLGELVAEAKKVGYATAKIDCRFIQVVDYRFWAGEGGKLEQTVEQSLADLGWSGEGRLPPLLGMSGATRIRDRGDPVVELAPVSIFPLPPEDVADLLLGFVDTSVHLNTELLWLRFAERGILTEMAVAPGSELYFLKASRGRLGFLMPAYVREQMLYELLSVESLVELSDWILRSDRAPKWRDTNRAPILGFKDEATSWSAGSTIDLGR